MPTAAQVSATWKSPPAEYGPEPYFDMSGSVDQAEVQRDLDAMKALGFRAVTPQAGVGMPFEYLSPEYFKFFQMLVAEAKKRDMRVWIVDDIGYPSGFAGGRFTREKPELRMQTLAVAERIAVEGGNTLRHPVSQDTVAVTAIGDDQSTIAVPVNDGAINWTAPAGRWQVLLIEHRFDTSPTRSGTNPKLATEPRPNTNNVQAKDKSQSLEDYLNPEATRQFLAFTHEQYKKYLGDEFGKTILAFEEMNRTTPSPVCHGRSPCSLAFQQIRDMTSGPMWPRFFCPGEPRLQKRRCVPGLTIGMFFPSCLPRVFSRCRQTGARRTIWSIRYT
jgi:hypothetical protein